MTLDDATMLPINNCKNCRCQVIGWVDNPEETFICEDCKKLNDIIEQQKFLEQIAKKQEERGN